MWNTVREHPFVTTAIAGILFFAAVWPLFSHDTVPDFLAKQGWKMMLPAWYFALVVALGVAVVLLQAALIRAYQQRPKTAVVVRSVSEIAAEQDLANKENARHLRIRRQAQELIRRLKDSTDALDLAFRACIGTLKYDSLILVETVRILELLIAGAHRQAGDVSMAVNRALQEGAEASRPSADELLAQISDAVSNHMNLCWALDQFQLLPDVLLSRPPAVVEWEDAVERLKAELRPLMDDADFGALRNLAGNVRLFPISAHAPQVVPSAWVREGLVIENLGAPAKGVFVDPIKLGWRMVKFEGPEVSQLKQEDGKRTFAAHVDEGEGRLHLGLSAPFRAWQAEVGDHNRETVGRITYGDFDGLRYATYYRIGIDVQNRDGGMVVEFLLRRRLR